MAVNYFKPDLFIEKISLLSIDFLHKIGIKGLIIDLDNTITEWNSQDILEDNTNWLKEMEQNNIKICIASNNGLSRVDKVAKKLGIPAIHKACKPRRRAFLQAMDVLGTSEKSTAVIGDQIFTDIFGGNRLGLFTILVSPINTKEFFGTKIMRKVEHLFLKNIVK